MTGLLSGTLAGLGATGPMTLVMAAMHRKLPARQQYPLPPRQITMNAAAKVGAREHLDENQRTTLTLLAHFSYGAFVGGIFGLLAPRRQPACVMAGMVYGVGVWAGSYLGLLPALRLLSPATRHPPERNALMIASHIVWGATTGALLPVLREMTDGK